MPQQLFNYIGKRKIALLIFKNKTSTYLKLHIQDLKTSWIGDKFYSNINLNLSIKKTPWLSLSIGCSLQMSAAFFRKTSVQKEQTQRVYFKSKILLPF